MFQTCDLVCGSPPQSRDVSCVGGKQQVNDRLDLKTQTTQSQLLILDLLYACPTVRNPRQPQSRRPLALPLAYRQNHQEIFSGILPARSPNVSEKSQLASLNRHGATRSDVRSLAIGGQRNTNTRHRFDEEMQRPWQRRCSMSIFTQDAHVNFNFMILDQNCGNILWIFFFFFCQPNTFCIVC